LEHGLETRLHRLERLLAEHVPSTHAGTLRRGTAAHVALLADELPAINVARMKALVDEIDARGKSSDLDGVDRVAIRLLLDDYRAAVGHLRAVVSDADRALSQSNSQLREARRDLQRLLSDET
jgi:hypothetical protein